MCKMVFFQRANKVTEVIKVLYLHHDTVIGVD